MNYLVVFDSVHQAIRAEKMLLAQGIAIEMVPTPREISASCGQSIALGEEAFRKGFQILLQKEISFQGVYHVRKQERIFERLILEKMFVGEEEN